MPWHRVGQRYACYTRTRNVLGSKPTHLKIGTCVQAIEGRNKLKRLMINSKKFNLKSRNPPNKR